jgi:hypothetical protein
MFTIRHFLALALLLFLLASPARARVALVYSSLDVDHFTIEIPDNWKVNVGAEPDPEVRTEEGWIIPRVVTAMPDDDTPLWFGIWVPPDVATLAEAKGYMDALGPVLLSDVVVKKRVQTRLNNLAALHVSGTGKKEDEPMDFHAFFAQLTPKTIVIAIYIGPHATTISHGRELAGMINTLRPAPANRGQGQ